MAVSVNPVQKKPDEAQGIAMEMGKNLVMSKLSGAGAAKPGPSAPGQEGGGTSLTETMDAQNPNKYMSSATNPRDRRMMGSY